MNLLNIYFFLLFNKKICNNIKLQRFPFFSLIFLLLLDLFAELINLFKKSLTENLLKPILNFCTKNKIFNDFSMPFKKVNFLKAITTLQGANRSDKFR